ncbi:rhodanese-like domain-containing protein [Methanofollis fontis]|nr:rhodanese-like domain-containing protein [Methanofollis fontis]
MVRWGGAALLLMAVLVLAAPGCTGGEDGGVREIDVSGARSLIEERQGDPSFVILDVRTPEEYLSGHIEGAINIDYYDPAFRDGIDRLDRSATYLVYCRTAVRSAAATAIMAEMGFDDLYDMQGGIVQWRASGYPTT